jgi:dTDP-4-dehydrorhamnose reductase
MKIFLAGAKGQLARSLAVAATSEEGLQLLALGRPTVDLRDRDTVARALDAAAPALVINGAAYTNVDRAESERDLAYAVNRDGAGALAEVTAQRNLPLIHVSTDYVFDGRKQEAYQETDPPNPQTVYGRSKLAGEERVAATNGQHIILRTSWVHSPYGHNFVRTILRLAGERPELRVVADQQGNPTYAADLASAILAIARLLTSKRGDAAPWGLYHVAGDGTTTWHGLAESIVAAAAQHGRAPVPVRAITTAEFPTPARRPANSRLDCRKLAMVFGLRLAPWRDGVARCVAQLCADADMKPEISRFFLSENWGDT